MWGAPAHPGDCACCSICSRLVTNSEELVEVIRIPSEAEVVEVIPIPSEAEVVEVIPIPSEAEAVEVIPIPSEAEVFCCFCKSSAEGIDKFVPCATCAKVYIHSTCSLDPKVSSELNWYCEDCDNLLHVPLSVKETSSGREYKMKEDQLSTDVELARRLITYAENKMPGLMAYRSKFGQILSGARISCCLLLCQESAVLIETLTALGAEVRCCSCNTSPIDDTVVSAIIARDSASVFAWDGESLQDYWLCIEKCMDWGPEGGPHLIVDSGGDATLFVHEGVRAEEEYERSGKLADPGSTNNAKRKRMLRIIRDSIRVDPKKYHKISDSIVGVSEESATGVRSLCKMQKDDQLMFSAMNLSDSITKNLYYGSGRCYLPHRLKDLILFSVDYSIIGKIAVVCGYGDAGKVCAVALKKVGANVMVTEIDPICALQAMMEGIDVVTLEDVLRTGDIFITATGCIDVITVDHMRKMKNNAVLCNIGHNVDEIDINGLATYPGIRKKPVNIVNSRIDHYLFPLTNRGIYVLAEDQDSLTNPGLTLANHLVAHIEFWNQRRSSTYEKKVYILPKHVEEEVARHHLNTFDGKIGRLTELTQGQADYMGVAPEGPYKRSEYHY